MIGSDTAKLALQGREEGIFLWLPEEA